VRSELLAAYKERIPSRLLVEKVAAEIVGAGANNSPGRQMLPTRGIPLDAHFSISEIIPRIFPFNI
jgi:hypothetical protein